MIRTLLAVFYLAVTASAEPSKLAITAAADLKFCLDLLVQDFKTSRPEADIQVTYGSSGKAFTQLKQGAPFDLYFSADVEYPNKLVDAGLTAGKPRLYALGRIVLWSAGEDASKLDIRDLGDPRFTKIAIANPLHAPYGRRAEDALRRAGIWEKVQSRLVLGENIAQAAQFVQSGSAPVGILALSLVKSPAFAGKAFRLIPDSLHSPLEQALVVLKRAEKNPLAVEFVDYLFQPQARRIFERYGFALPKE